MRMESAGPIIEFQGVWKYYPREQGENPVRGILQDIKGSIQVGKIISIVGPSGSGKSTLLSMANRMQTPDEGEIYFYGQDYRQYQVTELRRRIGLAHQTPTMLPGTVKDNINYGPLLRKMPLSSHDMGALLDLLGLDRQFLERSATELSGGEKQRVSLLRTLANNPEVLWASTKISLSAPCGPLFSSLPWGMCCKWFLLFILGHIWS
ncbi:MAG: ATP-binding cassette domain-containing protein [Clostridia bacterium]|nr:ATP-binding cassette domain-containing protein [Clostridia bacterium]